MKIEIQYYKRRYGFFGEWLRKIMVRNLPGKWEDVTGRQLQIFCRMPHLKISDEHKGDFLLFRFLNIPILIYARITRYARAELLEKLSFLYERCELYKFRIRSFRARGRKYYLPVSNFDNGVYLEFAFAETFLAQYQQSKKKEDAVLLAACICREANIFTRLRNYFSGGDIRVRFNKQVIERRAKKFRNLSPGVIDAIVLNYSGVHNGLCAKYTNVFTRRTETQKVLSTSAATPNFLELLATFSGDKLGPIDKAQYQNIHFVLSTLDVFMKQRETKKA